MVTYVSEATKAEGGKYASPEYVVDPTIKTAAQNQQSQSRSDGYYDRNAPSGMRWNYFLERYDPIYPQTAQQVEEKRLSEVAQVKGYEAARGAGYSGSFGQYSADVPLATQNPAEYAKVVAQRQELKTYEQTTQQQNPFVAAANQATRSTTPTTAEEARQYDSAYAAAALGLGTQFAPKEITDKIAAGKMSYSSQYARSKLPSSYDYGSSSVIGVSKKAIPKETYVLGGMSKKEGGESYFVSQVESGAGITSMESAVGYSTPANSAISGLAITGVVSQLPKDASYGVQVDKPIPSRVEALQRSQAERDFAAGATAGGASLAAGGAIAFGKETKSEGTPQYKTGYSEIAEQAKGIETAFSSVGERGFLGTGLFSGITKATSYVIGSSLSSTYKLGASPFVVGERLNYLTSADTDRGARLTQAQSEQKQFSGEAQSFALSIAAFEIGAQAVGTRFFGIKPIDTSIKAGTLTNTDIAPSLKIEETPATYKTTGRIERADYGAQPRIQTQVEYKLQTQKAGVLNTPMELGKVDIYAQTVQRGKPFSIKGQEYIPVQQITETTTPSGTRITAGRSPIPIPKEEQFIGAVVKDVTLYKRFPEPSTLTLSGGKDGVYQVGISGTNGQGKLGFIYEKEGAGAFAPEAFVQKGQQLKLYDTDRVISITSEVPITQPRAAAEVKAVVPKLPTKGAVVGVPDVFARQGGITIKTTPYSPREAPIQFKPSSYETGYSLKTSGNQVQIQLPKEYNVGAYDKPISITEISAATPTIEKPRLSLTETRLNAISIGGKGLSDTLKAQLSSTAKKESNAYAQYDIAKTNQVVLTRYKNFDITQQKQKEKQDVRIIEITGQEQITRTTTKQSQIEIPIQTITDLTTTTTTTKTPPTFPPITPTTLTPKTPELPPTKTPPIVPPIIPPFGLNLQDFGIGAATPKKKPKGKYQPSFTAIVFGIKGAAGRSEKSGFALRPIPTSKKEKNKNEKMLKKIGVKFK